MTNNQDTGIGPHGHENERFTGYYQRGCRCEECRVATRKYNSQYVKNRIAVDPEYIKNFWVARKADPVRYEKSLVSSRKAQKRPEERRRSIARSRRRAANHRVLLAAIKVNCGCVDCGYKKHHAALDFDHVSGTKVRNISLMVTCSWERLKLEVAKTEVVCVRCHRIRTTRRIHDGESSWAPKRIAKEI